LTLKSDLYLNAHPFVFDRRQAAEEGDGGDAARVEAFLDRHVFSDESNSSLRNKDDQWHLFDQVEVVENEVEKEDLGRRGHPRRRFEHNGIIGINEGKRGKDSVGREKERLDSMECGHLTEKKGH